MNVTRQQIRDARHPACRWTVQEIDDAIEARFPATDPIDLATLCNSWADDQALSLITLQQCVLLATALSGIKAAGALFRPRDALREIAGQLPV